MKEEEYEEMSQMDFLNAKQLTILSIIVLLVIQRKFISRPQSYEFFYIQRIILNPQKII